MRPPLPLLVGLVLLGACTFPIPQVREVFPPSDPTAPSSLDPSDPDVARRLGAGPPTQVDWRREEEGVAVIGIDTEPDSDELALIGAAVSEMPESLRRAAPPRSIVRAPAVGDRAGHERAAAYTKGADVYFLDRTFLISPGGSTRMDVARAYAHELAHVAQYRTLRPDYVRAVLEGRLSTVDPAAGSALVLDFAAATGWRDRSDDPLRPRWHLPDDAEASTSYGRVGPEEDMAEAVAMLVMGRREWIPADRAAWVEGWLGVSPGELGAGRPWAPGGSDEVLSRDPVYDQERVEELGEGFAHAETLYFALPEEAPDHPDLAGLIAEQLRAGGLEGLLEPSPDERLPRYQGLFARPDGVAFWVELWDFRHASGFDQAPIHPILTYVVLW